MSAQPHRRLFSNARRLAPLALAAALGIATSAGHAAVVDAAGDYVSGFAGSRLGDLDVLSANVVLNTLSNRFTLSGTVAAPIGTTSTGFFVWGVDRGAGTARFAGNGVPGVLFDMVVIVNPDGSARVNDLVGGLAAAVLPAGSALISGPSFSLDLAAALLPTRGFAPAAYTWNLWPRDGALAAGFGQISDFAPDNSNFATTAVPEPGSAALVALALGAVVATRKRKQG